jgi:hypothetical protein
MKTDAQMQFDLSYEDNAQWYKGKEQKQRLRADQSRYNNVFNRSYYWFSCSIFL